MSGLDLFERETAERIDRLTPIDRPETGTWDGFLRGTGMATMRTFAKAGRAIDMAGAVFPIAYDTITGGSALTERYFREHDEIFGPAVDRWTPKAGEVGAAGEIAGQLLATLPLVIASPALAIGSAQLGTAEDLSQKGVSAGKAQLVGAVQGAGLGLGIYMPIFGRSLWERMLVGGAGFNVVQGAAMRGVSEQILKGTAAEGEFKAFDGDALTLDLLLGVGFGAISHVSPRQRAEGAKAWEKMREWGLGLKTEDRDAISVLRQAQHSNVDSLPGKPLGAEDLNAHVDRVHAAVDQLARDERVEVGDLPAARVESDGKRWTEAEGRAKQIVKEAEKLAKELGIAPRAEVAPFETTGEPRETLDQFASRAGDEIGGVSHLKGIVEKLQRIYIMNGLDAGRAMLEDMASRAPESSGFSIEVATPRFIDELDAELAKRAKAFKETVDAPVTREAGTPPSASGEPARPAASDKPVDPLAAEAERIAAAHPDLQVTVGIDEAGEPIRRSAKDFLQDARQATQAAQEEMKLLQVAAECLLGVG